MKRSGELVIGGSGDRENELTAETRGHGGRSGNREIEMMNRVVQILRATLREIFDESAYDRFLVRTHSSRSTASYREFMRERDAAVVKKPRCC